MSAWSIIASNKSSWLYTISKIARSYLIKVPGTIDKPFGPLVNN